MDTFEIRLGAAHMLADGNRHMAFERVDGEPLSLIPGQFIQIHFPHEGVQLRRSYSVGTLENELAAPNRLAVQLIEIAVSYVENGIATKLLSNMQVGDTLTASGPNGRLCLPDEPQKRVILIATGTGVTPYRSMLPEIERRLAAGGETFLLMYGARSPDLLLYDQDFCQFADAHSGFEYWPCLSRAQRDDCRADDQKGRVTENLEALNADPERDMIYLCGNPDMIDDCFAWFRERGFDTRRLRREKYVSPPVPRTQTAPLKVL